MFLYRGENIINGNARKVDSLKNHLRYGFPLDFLNGGNPYHIEQNGFLPSTLDHVLQDNVINGVPVLKHFASFSSDIARAKYYARSYGGGYVTNEASEENLYEEDQTHSHESNSIGMDVWDSTDHLIIKLNIEGAFPAAPNCSYLKILNYGAGKKLLLMNCEDYLQQELRRRTSYNMDVTDLTSAHQLALRDQEWLVLALDRIEGGSRSALLAHGPLEIIHFIDIDR